MGAGGKRVGSGRKSKAPTKLKTFRIPVERYEEIVERIKALISFYNNADNDTATRSSGLRV